MDHHQSALCIPELRCCFLKLILFNHWEAIAIQEGLKPSHHTHAPDTHRPGHERGRHLSLFSLPAAPPYNCPLLYSESSSAKVHTTPSPDPTHAHGAPASTPPTRGAPSVRHRTQASLANAAASLPTPRSTAAPVSWVPPPPVTTHRHLEPLGAGPSADQWPRPSSRPRTAQAGTAREG